MDLSIIIAHYDPGNHPTCIKSFHKTLNQIESQKQDYTIEVIIADDGSVTHEDILSSGFSTSNHENQTIHCLTGENLAKWKKENNYDYFLDDHLASVHTVEGDTDVYTIGFVVISGSCCSGVFELSKGLIIMG